MVNLNKLIWEGWTVGDFVDELSPEINLIMSGRSYLKPFKNRKELAGFCKDNCPYIKREIPEVIDYFAELFALK